MENINIEDQEQEIKFGPEMTSKYNVFWFD